MVDALSLMVSNCVQGMISEGFEVGKDQVTLPHLHLADDSIFFC